MSNKNDENFTRIKNGVVYQNGKPICETFTKKYSEKPTPLGVGWIAQNI